MKIKNLQITSPSVLDLEFDVERPVCVLCGQHSALVLDLLRELIGDYGAVNDPDRFDDGHFIINSSLEIDGKDFDAFMKAWKELAHQLGLDDMVTFHGFVPREEAFRIMSSSHVFCITSVREDTSTVVFEAFRYGLPIIALDHCGFSTVIDETSGIKIPICSHSQVIADYARHLDYLASNEDERLRLSSGALARCQQFTWDAKMEVLNSIYANTQQHEA